MVYKTSDIVKLLTEMKNKPFGIKDIVYAKEHRTNSDARPELSKMSTSLFYTLEDSEIISSNRLTPYGSYLLDSFEGARDEYGFKNVEIVPKIKQGKSTYELRINPKTKKVGSQPQTIIEKKVKTQPKEISKEERIDEELVKLAEELKSNDYIKSFKADENELGFFVLRTKIPFHRTIQELGNLKGIATKLGTEIISSGEEFERKYHLKNSPITIVSKKRVKRDLRTVKGLGSYEPLRISIEPADYNESAGNMIKTLLKELK